MLVPFYESDGITIYQGDCLEVMPQLSSHSIDCILCDLPYGVTACKWDSVISFEPLWENYKRVIESNAAIVLTASQPFTSALVMSNIKWFKYCLVWDKCAPTGHLDANKKPLKRHEDIVVFCDGSTTYNPQMETRGKPRWKGGTNTYETGETVYHKNTNVKSFNNTYYPTSIVQVTNASRKKVHPTQKPVALMEYLIRTYTNEGDLVLDNTMGSGTTLLAARNTGRRAIGIELSEQYCEVAVRRVESCKLPLLSEVE